jgi:hypothetical protein
MSINPDTKESKESWIIPAQQELKESFPPIPELFPPMKIPELFPQTKEQVLSKRV